jgi:1-acyl-sn-glycerol-3-phosphate acyltransferase
LNTHHQQVNPSVAIITFLLAQVLLFQSCEPYTKRDWRGAENLPKSGPVIVVSNHISYADPLIFAHFLYKNGRAPRFLGKASVFKVPVIGKIIAGSGQIPVERETDNASQALSHAIAFQSRTLPRRLS